MSKHKDIPKFKKCHWNRENLEQISYFDTIGEQKKLFNKKYCLHPDANLSVCSGKIIKAHTIQRNGGLSRIARNGHVYHFDFNALTLRDNKGLPKVNLIGIRKASTFTGFCKHHDNSTFEPIEKNPFESNQEHTFLLAYRNICRELYLKRIQKESLGLLRNVDKGRELSEQIRINEMIHPLELGMNTSLNTLNHHKKIYDNALKTQNFQDVNYYVLRFDQTPDILCSGSFYPDFDFEGNRIQNLADMSKISSIISLSIITTDYGGAVVLSWVRKDSVPCNKLINTLNKIPDNNKINAILILMLTSIENVYFSPIWWENLNDEDQKKLQIKIMQGAHPFFPRNSDCLLDHGFRIIDWNLLNIESNVF